jgi:hypothetical protein
MSEQVTPAASAETEIPKISEAVLKKKLGSSTYHLLKVKPDHENLRGYITNAINRYLPDELKTTAEIIDWLRINLYVAPPKPKKNCPASYKIPSSAGYRVKAVAEVQSDHQSRSAELQFSNDELITMWSKMVKSHTPEVFAKYSKRDRISLFKEFLRAFAMEKMKAAETAVIKNPRYDYYSIIKITQEPTQETNKAATLISFNCEPSDMVSNFFSYNEELTNGTWTQEEEGTVQEEAG